MIRTKNSVSRYKTSFKQSTLRESNFDAIIKIRNFESSEELIIFYFICFELKGEETLNAIGKKKQNTGINKETTATVISSKTTETTLSIMVKTRKSIMLTTEMTAKTVLRMTKTSKGEMFSRIPMKVIGNHSVDFEVNQVIDLVLNKNNFCFFRECLV